MCKICEKEIVTLSCGICWDCACVAYGEWKEFRRPVGDDDHVGGSDDTAGGVYHG